MLRCERRIPIHPDLEKILAYRGGELPPGQAAKVAGHLETCARCRRELGRLENEVRQFEVLREPSPVEPEQIEEGLEKLLQRVHAYQQSTRRGSMPSDIGTRVVSELAVFFGSGVAASLGQAISAQRTGQEVLAVVEPLFTAFLGHRTASVLAGRVLEGAKPA